MKVEDAKKKMCPYKDMYNCCTDQCVGWEKTGEEEGHCVPIQANLDISFYLKEIHNNVREIRLD